jgi:transposase
MNRPKLTTRQRRKLERLLQETPDARVYRRTLAVLEHSRGRSVPEIAALLGVTRQSVYNWVQTFVRSSDPSALHDETRSGRPRLWTKQQQTLLCTLLTTSPDRLGYFAVNWRVPLFQEQIEHKAGKRLSQDTIRRALARQHSVWKRYRYVLDPDPQTEKKTLSQASPAL